MQSKVKEFMKECPQPMTVETCLADVTSELGEVAKEVNISTYWGKSKNRVLRPNAFTEVGQLLFTVYQLAETMGIDADKELENVIEDFRIRYAKNGHTGSSDYLD